MLDPKIDADAPQQAEAPRLAARHEHRTMTTHWGACTSEARYEELLRLLFSEPVSAPDARIAS